MEDLLYIKTPKWDTIMKWIENTKIKTVFFFFKEKN